MILKGLSFTPTSGCSRLKMAIHQNFTYFTFFPRSIYGLFAAPLQLNMVAKGCYVVFLVMLFPHIWARNVVGQSRLSKTHRNPITQSWRKTIYIYLFIMNLWILGFHLGSTGAGGELPILWYCNRDHNTNKFKLLCRVVKGSGPVPLKKCLDILWD